MNSIDDKLILQIVMGSYLNDRCGICGQRFTRTEVEESVWCPSDTGRIAHKECYEHAKMAPKEAKGDE